jgi:hypothetical protein
LKEERTIYMTIVDRAFDAIDRAERAQGRGYPVTQGKHVVESRADAETTIDNAVDKISKLEKELKGLDRSFKPTRNARYDPDCWRTGSSSP